MTQSATTTTTTTPSRLHRSKTILGKGLALLIAAGACAAFWLATLDTLWTLGMPNYSTSLAHQLNTHLTVYTPLGIIAVTPAVMSLLAIEATTNPPTLGRQLASRVLAATAGVLVWSLIFLHNVGPAGHAFIMFVGLVTVGSLYVLEYAYRFRTAPRDLQALLVVGWLLAYLSPVALEWVVHG